MRIHLSSAALLPPTHKSHTRLTHAHNPYAHTCTGSYYGKSSGAKQPSEGFNMKNGAEFYLGITEMLQAMDSTVDPCTDFCEYAQFDCVCERAR